MNCEECKQRPALYSFTQVVNGKIVEIKTCEFCASKFHLSVTNHASFHDLLQEYFNISPGGWRHDKHASNVSLDSIACSHCHLSWDQFREQGKFGCASCYVEFAPHLPNLMKKVHRGRIRHRGKVPARYKETMENVHLINQLKKDLQQCIANEDFEQAAILRDKVHRLQSEIEQKDGDL